MPCASASLLQDGYVVLDGFLDAATLAEVRGQAEIAIQAPAMAGCERPHNSLLPLRWDDAIVAAILDPARSKRLAAALDARDMRWISGYLSVKEPRSRALWWHQDWWCWGHPVSMRTAPAQVALLCYLSDTHERSGALRVLPGSHRRSTDLHALLPDAHALDAALPDDHAVMADHAEQVTLCARAGDAVALDYRLLHGTHPNAASHRRDGVLLSLAPSWTELPLDVRAHLIRHPAQPAEAEREDAGWQLLPDFDGVPADLELDSVAPAEFAVEL